jgi:hypothetical protein
MSAIDAVGRMIQRVEEVWMGRTSAVALLLDMKGAFTSIAKGNLNRRIEEMGFEADVCQWVQSFMSNTRAILRMDGREEKVMDSTTRVHQESPVSPIVFAIYISELFGKVEERVKDAVVLSFVDDVACVVEGENDTWCVQKLQK